MKDLLTSILVHTPPFTTGILVNLKMKCTRNEKEYVRVSGCEDATVQYDCAPVRFRIVEVVD